MRQRKLRNLDTKYEAYSDIIADVPADMRGRWAELSGGAPLFIEIGCGKGKFISELAAREPEHFFVAIEGNKSVMLRAMEKNYWYKRRLTYRDRLKSYFRVLKKEGTVTFKTDNTDLFNWSVLEIIAADLKILDITRDLHADSEANALNIETEYEAKYSGFGEKIKRVVIGRRA